MPLSPLDPLEQDERDHLAAQARKQREYTDGLRAMADWLDANPDFLPEPVHAIKWVRPGIGTDAAEAFRNEAALLSVDGGEVEHHTSAGFVDTVRKFAPHRIEVTMSKERLTEIVAVQHPCET